MKRIMCFELTVGERFPLFSILRPRFRRRLVLERLIERDEVHGETEDEDRQHREKSREILHKITDDDGPRPEQMVKRQEVQDLHAS